MKICFNIFYTVGQCPVKNWRQRTLLVIYLYCPSGLLSCLQQRHWDNSSAFPFNQDPITELPSLFLKHIQTGKNLFPLTPSSHSSSLPCSHYLKIFYHEICYFIRMEYSIISEKIFLLYCFISFLFTFKFAWNYILSPILSHLYVILFLLN